QQPLHVGELIVGEAELPVKGLIGRHEPRLVAARFRDMQRARIASDNTTELTKEEHSEMPPKALTPEHKQAMTAGRIEGQAVKAYSTRKGIAYATWRELGVSADVLTKAGVTRGS